MKNNKLQCKDISDTDILNFLLKLSTNKHWPKTGTWFSSGNKPPENSLYNVVPETINKSLILAKMKQLIKRRLVEGCVCGCRGDFEITDRGRNFLLNKNVPTFTIATNNSNELISMQSYFYDKNHMFSAEL